MMDDILEIVLFLAMLSGLEAVMNDRRFLEYGALAWMVWALRLMLATAGFYICIYSLAVPNEVQAPAAQEGE